MPPDAAAALVSFAFATSITPGPNNIMLTASGVNFGFARTIPHMLGIGAGFMVLLVAVGLGIGMVFAALPGFGIILKLAGAAYILWLAWKVAHAAPSGEAGARRAGPLTFLEAAAFQWVNVKAWVMAVSAMAVYVRPSHATNDIIAVTLIFGAVNVPSVSTWAAFGHALRDVLSEPRRIRIFNIGMALLLVASLVPIVATDLPMR